MRNIAVGFIVTLLLTSDVTAAEESLTGATGTYGGELRSSDINRFGIVVPLGKTISVRFNLENFALCRASVVNVPRQINLFSASEDLATFEQFATKDLRIQIMIFPSRQAFNEKATCRYKFSYRVE